MEQRTRARQLRSDPTDAEVKPRRASSARKVAGIRFNRQVPIESFICDFVARSVRLVVEVDGGQHAVSAEYDASRTCCLELEGYHVIRFWNNEVLENLEGVIAEIERTLAARPSPSPSRRREGS